MSEVIVVTSGKGGVGKTTTVINLAAVLAQDNKRVLIIDMDQQGNATSGLGIEKDKIQYTIYDLLIGQVKINDAILQSNNEPISIIPANGVLAGAEVELNNVPQKEYILKRALEQVISEYDFIFIDTPPGFNLLTINALTAANYIIIPMQCEYYALEGLAKVMQSIKLVINKTNKNLTILGILFTMYDARTKLASEVIQEVETYFKDYIFETRINRSVRLSEAPGFGVSCIKYVSSSKAAQQYEEVAKQAIERMN